MLTPNIKWLKQRGHNTQIVVKKMLLAAAEGRYKVKDHCAIDDSIFY